MTRRKRHKPEQIIKKLRKADAMLAAGKEIGQVCQALGVSEATFHRWRNQYGGMKAEEAKRLKELEGENKRLKKLLAEAELDKAILKESLEGYRFITAKLRQEGWRVNIKRIYRTGSRSYSVTDLERLSDNQPHLVWLDLSRSATTRMAAVTNLVRDVRIGKA